MLKTSGLYPLLPFATLYARMFSTFGGTYERCHCAYSVVIALVENVDPLAYEVPEPSAAVFHETKSYPSRVGVPVARVRFVPCIFFCDAGGFSPPFASNVIAYLLAGIVTVAVAVTVAPVHEPLDDLTPPFIVVVVAVSPFVNVLVFALTHVTVFPSLNTVSHEPLYDVPPMFSVPEYEAATDEFIFQISKWRRKTRNCSTV